MRALPPPAELNAAYERRVQQHPQPPKQLLAQQQGRGASSAPSSSSSALPAPAADAADVPLLFNWRIDRQLGLAAAAAASAKARKAAASAASAAGSSGADNSAADVRADAAAVAAGGLLLPQLAHPVLAHVLRLVEGGDAAAGVSGTGVAEEDVVAAAELIETVCGYGQQTDEVRKTMPCTSGLCMCACARGRRWRCCLRRGARHGGDARVAHLASKPALQRQVECNL